MKSKTGLIESDSLTPKIIHFLYESKFALASAFVRFSEHNESPEWKGKIFTLGQFREWYAKDKGVWSYYEDWDGFNVPSSAFDAFFNGSFDPLTESEIEIVNYLKDRKDKFYVIATYKGCDEDVFEHEVCHALYASNEKYKTEVDAVLKKHSRKLKPLQNFLKDLGYHKDLWADECHAYMSASEEHLIEIDVPYPKEAATALKKIRKKYLK